VSRAQPEMVAAWDVASSDAASQTTVWDAG
jgi:hypothetical protein